MVLESYKYRISIVLESYKDHTSIVLVSYKDRISKVLGSFKDCISKSLKCTRDIHIWDIRRGQPHECNGVPRPGRTPFLIRVSPVPGKYQ